MSKDSQTFLQIVIISLHLLRSVFGEYRFFPKSISVPGNLNNPGKNIPFKGFLFREEHVFCSHVVIGGLPCSPVRVLNDGFSHLIKLSGRLLVVIMILLLDGSLGVYYVAA